MLDVPVLDGPPDGGSAAVIDEQAQEAIPETPFMPPVRPTASTYRFESGTINGCTGDRWQTVKNDERVAIYMTSPAVVDPIVDFVGPSGEAHPVMARFADADGLWDQATADTVESKMDTLNQALRSTSYDAKCAPTIRCNNIPGAAAITPGAINTIHFCDGYFVDDYEWRATVIVHEMSHAELETGDAFYDCREGPTRTAVERAASYPGVAQLNLTSGCAVIPKLFSGVTGQAMCSTGGSNACRSDLLKTAEGIEAISRNMMGAHLDDLYKANFGVGIRQAGSWALDMHMYEYMVIGAGGSTVAEFETVNAYLSGDRCHGASRQGTYAYTQDAFSVREIVTAPGGIATMDAIWASAAEANMFSTPRPDGSGLLASNCIDYANFFAGGGSSPEEATLFFQGLETAIIMSSL